MCCKPTILVYVCIWVYSGQSCIWVLNVGAVRCAQMYYCKDRQRLVGVMANFYSTTQRVDFGCILFSNEPVSCTPKFLNCWMGPGQASTQDQSVQALMIHLCELKKCVGTLQWAEPQSTLRQKIPTRVGCIHRRGCVVFTLGYIGGYRVYGLNPELEQFHPFPRFRFFPPFFSIQNRLPEMHLFPPLPAFQPLPCFQ